jgi:hypothetical protein
MSYLLTNQSIVTIIVPRDRRVAPVKKWHGVAVFEAFSSICTLVYTAGARIHEFRCFVHTNPSSSQLSERRCTAEPSLATENCSLTTRHYQYSAPSDRLLVALEVSR